MSESSAEAPKNVYSKGAATVILILAGLLLGLSAIAMVGIKESQSYTQKFTGCEVLNTNLLTEPRYRSSDREFLVLRTSCGTYKADGSYATEIFPGDTVDLSVAWLGKTSLATPTLTERGKATEHPESQP